MTWSCEPVEAKLPKTTISAEAGAAAQEASCTAACELGMSGGAMDFETMSKIPAFCRSL